VHIVQVNVLYFNFYGSIQ